MGELEIGALVRAAPTDRDDVIDCERREVYRLRADAADATEVAVEDSTVYELSKYSSLDGSPILRGSDIPCCASCYNRGRTSTRLWWRRDRRANLSSRTQAAMSQ